VLDSEVATADTSRYHTGLGWLGVAHREAGVLESSAADPVTLAQGLQALLPSWRPVMIVVRGVSGRAEAAELALTGRAWPELLYTPDAGPSWADRLSLDGNPSPPEAWPSIQVDAVDSSGAEVAIQTPCTFVDAVAAGSAFAGHLRALPPQGWDDPALVPLDEFVRDFAPDDRVRRLPWVWTLEPGRVIGRAVVSRGLALACRDRAQAWKQRQELAGHGDVWAERAAAAERERAEAAAAARIAELEAAHAEALNTVADDAVAQAMDRLAGSLLSLDGPLVAAPRVPSAPEAPAPEVSAPAPEAGPEPVDEDEEDVITDDPYIDSFMCTTCNECTNINGELFAYNKDKQAEIVSASAGTFAQLVQAAEICPATCIHPGRPAPGDASATPDLVARAAAFG
jgi:ferredoxin